MNWIESLTDRRVILSSENVEIATKLILVTIVNVLFCSNQLISNIAVMLEVVILAIDAMQNKWVRYLGDYVLFCSMSIEYAVLTNVENIFGFKEIRVFGINLGIWALLPIFIHYFLRNKREIKILNMKQKDLSIFTRMYFVLVAISVLVGIFLYIINDNGISNAFTMRIIVEELYQKGAQPLLLISVFYFMVISEVSSSLDTFEKYLLATLYGFVASLLISFFFGMTGNYGGVNTLVATNNVRWIPLLLIFPLYKNYKNTTIIIIIGVIGAYFLLRYNATGKNIMLYALIPIIYIYIFFQQHKYSKGIATISIIPIVVITGLSAISELSSVSVLFNSKMNQVTSMVNSLFTTSVDTVEDSPRVRVLEFMYIIQEYMEKPYLALIGKGLGGTILKGNLAYDLSSFSQEELSAGLIYNVHESINKLFLSNGIMGLAFLVKTVIMGLKKIKSNPWIVIGLYWLLVSLGHSITMTAFGLSCLMYGLIETKSITDEEY